MGSGGLPTAPRFFVLSGEALVDTGMLDRRRCFAAMQIVRRCRLCSDDPSTLLRSDLVPVRVSCFTDDDDDEVFFHGKYSRFLLLDG